MYWRCCDYKKPFKGVGINGGFPNDQGYKVRVLNYQIWVRKNKTKTTSVKVTSKFILSYLTFSPQCLSFLWACQSSYVVPSPKTCRPARALTSCRHLVMTPGTRARVVWTRALCIRGQWQTTAAFPLAVHQEKAGCLEKTGMLGQIEGS